MENYELIKLQLLHNEWKSIIKGEGVGCPGWVSGTYHWAIHLYHWVIYNSSLFFHTLTIIFSSHLYPVCSKLKCASSYNYSQLFFFCFWERIGSGRYQFSTHGDQILYIGTVCVVLSCFQSFSSSIEKHKIQSKSNATNMRVAISSLSLIATFFIFKRGNVLAKDGK